MSTTARQSPHALPVNAHIARRVILAGLLSVAIASLSLAVPALQGVATQVKHLDVGWVLAAVALERGSCLAFVVVFRLFFDQGAGALLPGGGVGALAIGGWLLRREGISKRQV